jgi:hypothetical protein
VLSAAATVARHVGDNEEAAALGRQAVARWREVGDALAIGKTLAELAVAERALEAPEERASHEEAIRFARENHLTDVLAATLANFADYLISTGSLKEGRAVCEESHALSVPGSSEAWVAAVNLAYIDTLEGPPD